MFKKVIGMAAVLVLVASVVSANTVQWIGAGYSDTPGAWEDSSNWSTGSAPVLTDNYVRAYRSDNAAGSNITISSDVSGGTKFQMKYGNSKVTINNGGTLTNLDGVEMFGFLSTDTSEVDILAGGTWNACTTTSGAVFNLTTQGPSHDTVSVWGALNVDGASNPQLTIGTTANANGYGTLNIYGGGLVYADRYSVGSHGVINMWGGSTLKINGNVLAQTTADLGTKIVGQGGAVLSTYYSANDNATYVIPEPATIALLGLGGLLFRKRG